MKIKKSLLFTVVLSLVVILQTTVLSGLQVRGVRPDLALLLLVFFSHILGPMEGKLMGFFLGLLRDFLSLSPLGFHAVVDTTVGHIFGFTKEKLYIDAISLPLILAAAATVIKAFWTFILIALFLPEKVESFFKISLLVEIGVNAFVAPFLFALLRLFGLIKDRTRTAFD